MYDPTSVPKPTVMYEQYRAEVACGWGLAAARRYYAQFVTHELRVFVLGRFGNKSLVAGENRGGAFDEIPLAEWQTAVTACSTDDHWLQVYRAGDVPTNTCVVQILKEAARQVREQALAEACA